MSAVLQNFSLHGLRRIIVGRPSASCRNPPAPLGPMQPGARSAMTTQVYPHPWRNTSCSVGKDEWHSTTPVEEAAVATLHGAVTSGEIAREPARLDGVKSSLVRRSRGRSGSRCRPLFLQRAVTGSDWRRSRFSQRSGSSRCEAHRRGQGTIGTCLSAVIGSATASSSSEDRSLVPGPASWASGAPRHQRRGLRVCEYLGVVRSADVGRANERPRGRHRRARGRARRGDATHKVGLPPARSNRRVPIEPGPGRDPLPGRASRARSGRRGPAPGHRGAHRRSELQARRRQTRRRLRRRLPDRRPRHVLRVRLRPRASAAPHAACYGSPRCASMSTRAGRRELDIVASTASLVAPIFLSSRALSGGTCRAAI